MLPMQVLTQVASLLETGEEQQFQAFGANRAFQATLKDGLVDSFELWGNGAQMLHCYPEPVSLLYAAVCVMKSLVDEHEDEPEYAPHTKEFYSWLATDEGKFLTTEAKWKGEKNE